MSLEKKIRDRLDLAYDKIDGFIIDLEGDALTAMQWSDSVFGHAAEIRLAENLLMLIRAGQTRKQLEEYLSDAAINNARFPSNSSSSSANAAHLAMGRMYASYLRDVLPQCPETGGNK